MKRNCFPLSVKIAILIAAASLVKTNGWAQEKLRVPKPIPLMQAVPLPDHQVSFQRDGVELTRYYFNPLFHRPFLYPMIGPSGRSLTRMGHPHDPDSHSHHNSVWISHNSVNGVNFWGDTENARILCKRIVRFEDGDDTAYMISENEWIDPAGRVLMNETRRVTVQSLAEQEWQLVIDLEFKAKDQAVTLGQTPFGMMAVRMAKTIGVNDGGGTIRNSEGGTDEKEVFWKRAKWVDYSGPITNEKLEGIVLFDHPDNPNFPSYFHVRNDGWMGASLTFDATRTLEIDQPLQLRYGLYIHQDVKAKPRIDSQWERFSKTYAEKPAK